MAASRITVRRRQHLRYGAPSNKKADKAWQEGVLTVSFLSGALVALVIARVL